MNIRARSAGFLAVLLALAACTPLASETASSSAAMPAASAEADEGAIRVAGDAWNAAYRALNSDALVALYATDAMLMPESAQTAKGQAAIHQFLRVYMALLADGGYTPVITNGVEIEVSGNLGSRSGTYSILDRTGTVVDTGKWLEIWRRSGGKWYIARDIWNSDSLPLFPPASYTGEGGSAG